MYTVPYCEVKYLGGYAETKNFEVLHAFAESEYDRVEVKGFDTKSASGCASSLRNSIKRFNLPQKVSCKDGHVYLSKRILH